MTTAVKNFDQRTGASQGAYPLGILANIAWNVVVILGSLAFGIYIIRLPGTFADLGTPVQMFTGVVALIPAVLGLLSCLQLLQRKAGGRYLALLIDFLSLVFAGIALLHLWGVFIGFDNITSALMRNILDTNISNVVFLWGLVIAYLIYWVGGRFGEDTPLGSLLSKIALGLAILCGICVLFFGGAIDAVFAILSTYVSGNNVAGVWIATIIVVISAVVGWQMLNLGRYFGETPAQQEAWQGWLMLAPNAVGFMIFFAGPLLLSLYISFTNDSVGHVPDIIGFKNYGEILSLQIRTTTDPNMNAESLLDGTYSSLGEVNLGGTRYIIGARDILFWGSLRNTILYCLMLIPLSLLPALGLAMILNSRLPGMKFYRAVYFLPSVAAVVGTALIWKWMYDPVIGYINYGISSFVTFLTQHGISAVDPKIEWLTNEGTVLFALVLMGGWSLIGFNTVLFLAGLQGIPRLLYEAAYVDGANEWERFRFVTLPLLAPTTFFVVITTVITGLQVFNEPYALISQRPMPLNATTAVYYLYDRGFSRFEFGYASAVAWILFAVIFFITLVQFRLQQNKAYDV